MKKLVMLALATAAALAAMTSTAMAHPSYAAACSGCHRSTTAITLSATQIANNGVTATYRVATTGTGWAVLDGRTNKARASAKTGTFSVALGKTYMVWAANPNVGARSIKVSPAVPTAVANYVRSSNPIAYGMAAMATTRFSTSVKVAGASAVLSVATPKGPVYLYRGSIPTANTAFLFPLWRGMGPLGTRLATGYYTWTLSLTKNGQISIKTGRILVSRTYFTFTGTSVAKTLHVKRTLVPGLVICTVSAATAAAPDKLLAALTGPLYRAAIGSFAIGASPVSATKYLTGTSAIKTKGTYDFAFTAKNAKFTIGVAQ